MFLYLFEFLYSLFKSASALFYITATCIAKTMPIFPLYFPCLSKATLLYPLSAFSFHLSPFSFPFSVISFPFSALTFHLSLVSDYLDIS